MSNENLNDDVTIGVRTIDLNEENHGTICISIDENTSTLDYKNTLIHSFIWDLVGVEQNDIQIENEEVVVNPEQLQSIQVIPLNENKSVEIYNLSRYESPQEVKYSTVIIPSSTRGIFTYYYSIQGKVEVDEPPVKTEIGVTYWAQTDDNANSLIIDLSQEYFDVFSIRFEPITKPSEENKDGCFVYLEGEEISFIDGQVRTYYNIDINYSDLIIGNNIAAYIYGVKWKGV